MEPEETTLPLPLNSPWSQPLPASPTQTLHTGDLLSAMQTYGPEINTVHMQSQQNEHRSLTHVYPLPSSPTV